MKYDFESIPDRSGCGSEKWQNAKGASVDQVPLSTADMEFPTAPEIVEELKKTAETTILGYTGPTREYVEAVCGWMARRHGWQVDPAWMIQTPGVVYALGVLIRAMSEPGDGVIILTPVYYPFDLSALANERNIVYSELKLEGTAYTIDYQDLEEKAQRPENKILMFCNPHNPVGRVWTRDELEKVADICLRNNVLIIDDEIHHDLIMPGYTHTMLPTISEEAAQICAVCTAPSKTFNLAGLQCSNIIIPDPQLRAKVQTEHLLNLNTSLNIFAYRACICAYTKCDAWLEELITVIQGNAQYAEAFFAEYFPEVSVIPLEGTYLLWVDMRALGMTHTELETLMKEDAGLYLDEGYVFGTAGIGFERFNIACSRITLERSLERFRAAMEKKRAQWKETGRPYHTKLKAGEKLEGFVYDTVSERNIRLEERIQKPTVILFSRYYTCPVCQETLRMLNQYYPALAQAGFDLKAVLQTSGKELAEAGAGSLFDFELICDPQAELYDRYEVYEAVGVVQMLGGNAQLLRQMGGVRQVISSAFGGEETQSSGRQMQLPAVFVILPDMTVAYAYYGQHIMDLPDFDGVLAQLSGQ